MFETYDLSSQRKGMKATVVLFFFLGMSSLLFCINPKDEGIYEDAYMVTNAILKVQKRQLFHFNFSNPQGSQGSIVCIFYCVFSSDVRMALSKRWYQFKVISFQILILVQSRVTKIMHMAGAT